MIYRCGGITKCNRRCKLKSKKSDYCKIHENNCSICFNNIKDNVTLDCNHIFCGNCILKWICTTANCPLCRSPVNEFLKEKSLEYGVLNKIYLFVYECFINISNLEGNELMVLDYFGITDIDIMTEDEWESVKQKIPDSILEKIEIETHKCILKANNEEEYIFFTRFNKIFAFI